jgi:hypothetical protein
MNERYVDADPPPGDCRGATDRSNHDHAIRMVTMHGGVRGAASDPAALIGATA